MTTDRSNTVHASPVRGDLIRQLRETFDNGAGLKSGMSRQVFATKAGISTSTLQRAEEGEPGTTITTLRGIAGVLGVPLSSIYSESLVDTVPIPADQQRWEQLDARLASIESDQREILRLLGARK